MPTFKSIRVLLLLSFLLFVLFVSTHQRVNSRSWTTPLEVVVYPINADNSPDTADYISQLRTEHFKQIDLWFYREARRYDLALDKPVQVTLGQGIDTLPPLLPTSPSALTSLWWGLNFRWWAFRNSPRHEQTNLTRIRIFVMYYQGEEGQPLAHSLGMQQGLFGLVHAFAIPGQTDQNNVVITHELLHTVGAADKYDARGLPVYPYGYANANRSPLFPQFNAEIMVGRIPDSYQSAMMANSLNQVIINRYTAVEINWLPTSE